MNYKRVAVAVDMDEVSITTLSQIKDLNIPTESHIHLVHIFELNFFSLDFFPPLQPTPENYLLIQKLMEEKLLAVQKKLGLEDHENVVLKCLFSSNAKHEFVKYSNTIQASVVIAASKEKEGFSGLFESSFTSYLNKFSHKNFILFRPQ